MDTVAGDGRRSTLSTGKMPSKDPKSLLARIQSSQLGYLHDLNDAGLVDFAQVELIIAEVVRDRMALARQFYEQAKDSDRSTDILQRRTISSCYYAQYHAARSLVLYHQKVDRDDHKKLPSYIEEVLPGRGISPILEKWLSRRRFADYDPYVTFDVAAEAQDALKETEAFVAACEAFLKQAGAL